MPDDDKHEYGETANGEPLTDELIEELAAEAEAGYDVEQMLHRRPGRPAMGASAAAVESVRLDPALQEALAERAAADHTTTSAVIREALRRYLDVA
jgi:hypothetical protein